MTDVRRDGWFGSLVLSGVRQPSAHRGSILAIIAESIKDIQASRVRTDSDGESEIVIRIRNKPFDTSKDSQQFLDKSVEVDSLLDSDTVDGKREGESFEACFNRLLTEGYPRASALMLASDWHGLDPDKDTENWLHDSKAIRFRELNSRQEAFEAAIPQEYETLKRYVLSTYPAFAAHLTFRTA